MNVPELVLTVLAAKLLFGDKKPAPTSTPAPPQRLPPPPITTVKPAPQIPAAAPMKPNDIPWPGTPQTVHAGVPGAQATARPMHAGVPGASATIDTSRPAPVPQRPPPPPPTVDPKMPTAQKGAPAVSTAAQRAVDAIKADHSGTGKRQYKPKRKHLTQTNISRAKQLLGGWQKGKTWNDADDPSVKYVAVKHGTKHGIEVWSSNPDDW